VSDNRPDGQASRHFGLHPAIVTDIVDPSSLGRIQVRFPWLGDDGGDVRAWATLLTPYADDNQGFEVLPAVDSEVVVGFEFGDLRRPYIVGCCWNGQESLPVSPDSANNKRIWKTRSGSMLEFDDTQGAAKVTLSMDSGHKLVLDDSSQQVTLAHANGCTITFTAAGTIQVQANVSLAVSAPLVSVDAAVAEFSGVITCETLIANSGIVSPSYTPGAGNIW